MPIFVQVGFYARANAANLRTAIEIFADFHQRPAREHRIECFGDTGHVGELDGSHRTRKGNRQERVTFVDGNEIVEKRSLLRRQRRPMAQRRIVSAAIDEPSLFDEMSEDPHEQRFGHPKRARKRDGSYSHRPRLVAMRFVELGKRANE